METGLECSPVSFPVLDVFQLSSIRIYSPSRPFSITGYTNAAAAFGFTHGTRTQPER